MLPSAEPCACDPGEVCDQFRSSFCGEDIANYPVDEINVSSSFFIVHTPKRNENVGEIRNDMAFSPDDMTHDVEQR